MGSPFTEDDPGRPGLGRALSLHHPSLRGLDEPRRATIRKLGEDRARTLEALERLSVTGLLVIEILLDSDGLLRWDDVFSEVQRRSRRRADQIERAAWAVVEAGLAVFLESTRAYHGPERTLTLVVESATHLDVVRGISLPKRPTVPVPDLPPEAYVEARDLVALATLTAHRPVRANMNGELNLTSVKTVAKALKLDVQKLDERLREAIERGWLTRVNGAVEPRARVLGALEDAHSTERAGRALAPYVRSEWRSLEEIARLEMRGVGPSHGMPSPAIAAAAKAYPTVEHDGELFVAAPADRARPVLGDGHVTPNMEVLLGPDAHPRVTAIVGLAAELVKLDRVLTFRLSPQSIGRALSLGLSASEITTALDQVGGRPAPENVRANVLDMASRSARVTRSAVARCKPESASSVRAHLGKASFEEPAPGVFIVDEAERTVLLGALSRAGIAHYEVTPEPAPDPFVLPRARLTAAPAPYPVSSSPEHARLVDRLDAAIASRFKDDHAALEPPTASTKARAAASSPKASARQTPGDWSLTDFNARAARNIDRVDAWLKRLHGTAARRASEFFHSGGMYGDLLLLGDAEATRAFASSWSVEELGSFLAEVIGIDVLEDRMSALRKAATPAVGAMSRVDRGTLEHRLRMLADDAAPIYVEARTGDGVRVTCVVPERVMKRGKDVVMLAHEVESDAAISIRLDDVLAVAPTPEFPAMPDPAPAAASLPRVHSASRLSPGEMPSSGVKPGRNDPCPCGSGTKYKKCHGA